MSTNVSKSNAFVGNIAIWLQNRDDNFNWFDDHERCLGNVKLTFGEDVKKGETRWLGSFLGNGDNDDITTTVRKNGTLVIEIPNAENRTQPILQNNGITSKRITELSATIKSLVAAMKAAGMSDDAIAEAVRAAKADAAANNEQPEENLPF